MENKKYYKFLKGEKYSLEKAIDEKSEYLKDDSIIVRDEERGYMIYRIEEIEKEVKKDLRAYNEVIHGWRKQKYYIDFDGLGIPMKSKDKVKEILVSGIEKGFLDVVVFFINFIN